jgi:hypothetical protein
VTTALKDERPYTSIISLILTGFESDLIVIHNPTIPAAIKELALDKFTSFLSVPAGCNVQIFIEIIGQVLPSLDKTDFGSIESVLQTVDCCYLPVTIIFSSRQLGAFRDTLQSS